MRSIWLALVAIVFSSGASSQNLTGIYWNPSESGWGLTVFEQGGVCAAGVYTFSATRRPVWYIFSGNCGSGTFESVASTARGGTSWKRDFVPGSHRLIEAGTARLSIDRTTRRGTLTATFFGVAATKQIEELKLANAPVAYPYGVTGIYWGGVANSGWGLPVIHQGDTAAALLYSYDDDGEPIWMINAFKQVAGSGTREVPGTLFGSMSNKWSTASGPPWGSPHDPRDVVMTALAEGPFLSFGDTTSLASQGCRISLDWGIDQFGGTITARKPCEYFQFGPTESPSPPNIISSTPNAGGLHLPAAPIFLMFDTQLNANTTNSANVTLRDSAGTLIPRSIALDPFGLIVTITPTSALRHDADYVITVRNVQGLTRGLMPERTIAFRTRSATRTPKLYFSTNSGAQNGRLPNTVSNTTSATQGISLSAIDLSDGSVQDFPWFGSRCDGIARNPASDLVQIQCNGSGVDNGINRGFKRHNPLTGALTTGALYSVTENNGNVAAACAPDGRCFYAFSPFVEGAVKPRIDVVGLDQVRITSVVPPDADTPIYPKELAYADGKLYVLSDQSSFKQGRLARLDVATLKFDYNVVLEAPRNLVVAGGRVYISNYYKGSGDQKAADSDVWVLDAATGQLLTKFSLPIGTVGAGNVGGIAANSTHLFVGGGYTHFQRPGRVYRYRLSDLQMDGSVEVDGRIQNLTQGAGKIYASLSFQWRVIEIDQNSLTIGRTFYKEQQAGRLYVYE